jgi:suppressor of ftsI
MNPAPARFDRSVTRLRRCALRFTAVGMLLAVAATGATAQGHEHHHAPPTNAAAWRMPPMDMLVMMPGIAGRIPLVAPFLPGNGVDPASLPAARFREIADLADGDTLRLEAMLVRRSIKGRDFVMYGFNGQYPGPLIRVAQGATIFVDFVNSIDMPSTIHWHGVRLDNRFDGVPGLTQDAVEPGGRFLYEVRFDDAGIYWYHPHVREDIQQDLGLYGNMLVGSPDPDYYGPAHRDEVVMLDDLLIDEAGLFPWGAEHATHALMGRFGNVFLTNGEPDYRLEVARGEVVRFHLTNVANARTFNISFGGNAIKLVASDLSRFEREQWVESVVLAPAQRYVVDVRFDEPGNVGLVNRVQGLDHMMAEFTVENDTLGTIVVGTAPAAPDLAAAFATLRTNADVAADLERFRPHFDRAPDHELVLSIHVGDVPAPVLQMMVVDTIFFPPVEWTDGMVDMNWLVTTGQVTWQLRDAATGRVNEDIAWEFRTGDVVKLRVTNDPGSFHPMHHPIHLHGQRFLLLDQDGVRKDNLVWRDTVLVPVGSVMDLLVEMSNPGQWMVHCHIAEHLEAGMSMVITVSP